MHFSARAERQRLAKIDHEARRREVEANVASKEWMHTFLRNHYGLDYADRWMNGA